MVKNPAPKLTFSRKHISTKKNTFFGKQKAPQGYPLEIARWARGAGPGPNVNGKGQGAGPGPRLNGRGQGARPGPRLNEIGLILSK